MPNSLSIVQFISLFLSFLATILQIAYLRRRRNKWGFVAPWVLYTLHVFLYYVFLAIATYDLPAHLVVENLDGPLFFQHWSSVIRLHTLLTVLGITLIIAADER